MSSKSLFAIVFLLACSFATYAHAATLGINPGSDTFSEGKTFSVRVVVGSGGQSVNAVSGKLLFSTDTLSLTKVSKSGIVTLWAQEPSYSNAAGTVSFQGVILNGYSGASGTVLTLTFRAKSAGTASITFSPANSSVLLNDGQGTDVLSGTSGASYTITKAAVKEPAETPEAPVEVPAAPEKPPVPVTSEQLPVFTDYPDRLTPGSFVVIKGKASPSGAIVITLTQTDKQRVHTVTQSTVTASDTGVFAYVSDEKVVEGSTYSVVAATKGGLQTEALHLTVKNSLYFIIAAWVVAIMAVQMSVVVGLLILILTSAYLLYRNHVLKQHMRELVEMLKKNQEIK
ncbi:MAG: cohesin domain-containing protein [Patescibacteria group bacterium]